MQPAIRQPVHITGLRAVGDRPTEMVLLIDLARDTPPEGTYVFFSPHKGYRIQLRPYKKMTLADGTIKGEVFPIEAQFTEGRFVTQDTEVRDLLLASKSRGHGFYAFEDLLKMRKEAVETQMEDMVQKIAASGVDAPDLLARLTTILGGQKVFEMPKDEDGAVAEPEAKDSRKRGK